MRPISDTEKPLTAKGRATRDRIVHAAATLMYEHGANATRLDDVMGLAGVGNSQMYHYFADKNELVRAVIAHQTDAIVGSQEEVLQNLNSMAGLRRWRDYVVATQRATQCRGGCPIGSLGSELAEHDENVRLDVYAAFGRWQDAIRDGLRNMRDTGLLPANSNPEDLAVATLSAIQGGLLLGQIDRSTRPLEIAMDTMLGVIETISATHTKALLAV